MRNAAELTDVIKRHLIGEELSAEFDEGGRVTRVGAALLGRVVDALGQPVDGKGPVATREFRAIERGLLDDLPIDAVRRFESCLYDWLDRSDSGLLKEIRDERELSDALRDALIRAVQEAKTEFIAPGIGARVERDPYKEDGGEA